jgi:hypothetical protein
MLYLFYWISSISLMSSWFVIRRCILLTVSASYPHLIHILSYPHHCCRRHRHPGTTLLSPRSIGVSLSYSFVISLQHIGILASCTSRTSSDLVGGIVHLGRLEALRTSMLTTVCIWDKPKVASICKWEESAEYFPWV